MTVGAHRLSCARTLQGASEDVVQAQIAPAPDDPQPLGDDEIEEKEQLLSEGFSNWNRRDFNAFVRACEKVHSPMPLLACNLGHEENDTSFERLA